MQRTIEQEWSDPAAFFTRRRSEVVDRLKQLRSDNVPLHEVTVVVLDGQGPRGPLGRALTAVATASSEPPIVVLPRNVARTLLTVPHDLAEELDRVVPGETVIFVVTPSDHYAIFRLGLNPHPVPSDGAGSRWTFPIHIDPSDVSPRAERLRLMERATDRAARVYDEALDGDADPTSFILAIVDADDHAVWSTFTSMCGEGPRPREGYAVVLLDNAEAIALAGTTAEAVAQLVSARDQSTCRILVGAAGGWLTTDFDLIPVAPC